MSFFQSYRATEGLSRFPPDKQFCVWLSAHKKLKANDPAYRTRCRRFVWRHLIAVLVPTIAYVVILVITSWPRPSDPTVPDFGYGMVREWLIGLGLTAIYVPYLVIVSLIFPSRHQRWLNSKVAEEIKKS